MPFSLSVEYINTKQVRFNASLSFNKYKAGKSVDNRIVQKGSEAGYVAFDLSTKYFPFNTDHKFEPYFMGGFGVTSIGSYVALQNIDNQLVKIPAVGRLTMNGGLGANYWFSNSWGVNVNIMGKIGVKANKEFVENQTQFSLGLIYSPRRVGKWR